MLARRAELGLSTVVDFELIRREVSEEATLAIQEALEDSAVVSINNPDLMGVGLRIMPPFETHEAAMEALKAQTKHLEARAAARKLRRAKVA